MLIKSVLMDNNEGLYIDLKDIEDRTKRIEAKLEEPETPITPIGEADKLINEIDIGETAVFKAWKSCYYTRETQIVGYDKDSYYEIYPRRYLYDSTADLFYEVEVSLSPYKYNETPEVYDGYVPSSSNSVRTTVYDVWVDDNGSSVKRDTESDTIRLQHTYDVRNIPVKTTVYTRHISNDIIFYTLKEPNDGKDDIATYLTQKANEYNTVLNTCTVVGNDTSYTQYNILDSKDKPYTYPPSVYSGKFTPNKFSCITQRKIYQPVVFGTSVYIWSMYDELDIQTKTCTVQGTNVYYLPQYNAYEYIRGSSSSEKNACYLEELDPVSISNVVKSMLALDLTPDPLQILTTYSSEADYEVYVPSMKHTYKFSEITNKLKQELGKDTYNRTVYYDPENYSSSFPTIGLRNTLSITEEKFTTFIEKYNSAKVDDFVYLGSSTSYSYQNYTFKNLSAKSPVPVYMKGTDGKMYLVGQISYTYDEKGNVKNTYAGPYYSSDSDYAYKIPFSPFGLYTRQDEYAGSTDNVYSKGGFVRVSSADITSTLAGVVEAGYLGEQNLEEYYDKTTTDFTTYTSKVPTINFDSLR